MTSEVPCTVSLIVTSSRHHKIHQSPLASLTWTRWCCDQGPFRIERHGLVTEWAA